VGLLPLVDDDDGGVERCKLRVELSRRDGEALVGEGHVHLDCERRMTRAAERAGGEREPDPQYGDQNASEACFPFVRQHCSFRATRCFGWWSGRPAPPRFRSIVYAFRIALTVAGRSGSERACLPVASKNAPVIAIGGSPFGASPPIPATFKSR